MLRQVKVAKFLIRSGANVQERNELKKTPFDFVKDPKILKELEKFAFSCTPEGKLKAESETASLDLSQGPRDIWTAAYIGDVELTKSLLDYNSSLCNAQDNRGNTPLMFACIGDKMDVADLLLDKGADVNVKNMTGNNAISYARGPKRAESVNHFAYLYSPAGRLETELRMEQEAALNQKAMQEAQEAYFAEVAEAMRIEQTLTKNLRRIRKYMTKLTVAVCISTGLDSAMAKTILTRKQMADLMEAAKLRAEMLEKQRVAEEYRLAGVVRLKARQEAEAEALRQAQLEAERAYLDEQLRQQRQRQETHAKALAAAKAKAEAEFAERLRLAVLTEEVRKAAAQKDKEDIPHKLKLVERMRQSCGRIK